MEADIFEIKRFAVHDGDGIRTTVFFKGCPLKCRWCHNPEGIGFKSEMAYYKSKCIGCAECVRICPQKAHSILDGEHIFDRKKCVACGKCEDVCFGKALTLYGKKVTVSELVPILIEDRDFYENSGGGVTLSGGECLMQANFCKNLLKKLKELDIHTAVDTCGLVSVEEIDKVIDYTDVFLYDFKAFDEKVHIEGTGQSNQIILENLKYLDSCGKSIEIRIPYIPEYNENQIEKIAEFLSGLKNVTKVRVLPYHNYAGNKYDSLDMKNTLPDVMPDEEQMENVRKIIHRHGLCVCE